MTQFIAKVDIPPNVKAGDVVTATEPLIPEFARMLEKVGANTEAKEVDPPKEGNGSDDTLVTNPDRNALKDEATSLGINFAPNIPTARLIELIEEARAKKEAEAASEEDDNQPANDEGESDDEPNDAPDGDGSDDEE